MKLAVSLALAAALIAASTSDPYASLAPADRTLLKPQVERWIHDQVERDWLDLWEIQDQTPALKNELLLGHRNAPDLDRKEYAQAMQETMGIGYPEIKKFTLREVRSEGGAFRVIGCGKLQREAWEQTSITEVKVRIENGKVLFGLPGGTPDRCEL
jgi:hypothetical protein